MEEIDEDFIAEMRKQGFEIDYENIEEGYIKLYLRSDLLTTDEQEIQEGYDDLKARKSDD